MSKNHRRGIAIDPDDTESVCFLFEGRLKALISRQMERSRPFFVESGDFCGETTLFDELAKPEYVIALSNLWLLKFRLDISDPSC